jgi:4-hydroxy-tetrahydrodipicolinate synthase
MMVILRDRPADFTVLSGDDSLSLPLIAVGGDGCISVLANEMPGEFTRMIHAALDNRWDEARRIHYETYSLMRANFVETNPVPVKAALAMMGMIEEVYRLPLCPMQPKNREKLAIALRELKLIA